MKVIETYVAWSNRYRDYVMVYMCQAVNSQEIAYYEQHKEELWKLSELEVEKLLNTKMVPNE